MTHSIKMTNNKIYNLHFLFTFEVVQQSCDDWISEVGASSNENQQNDPQNII